MRRDQPLGPIRVHDDASSTHTNLLVVMGVGQAWKLSKLDLLSISTGPISELLLIQIPWTGDETLESRKTGGSEQV